MELEKKRLELHEILCDVLQSRNCYYSPPTGFEMAYPCIIYKLGGSNPKYADNIPYFIDLEWDITVVDEDPDSKIANNMMQMPKCRFERLFTSDDLNHFVFALWF